MNDLSLIRIEDAKRKLEEANSIHEQMQFESVGEAFAHHALRAGLAIKTVNEGMKLALDSQRKQGFLLEQEAKKRGRGRSKRNVSHEGALSDGITISKKRADNLRRVHKVPDEEFARYHSLCNQNGEVMSQRGVIALLSNGKPSKKPRKVHKTMAPITDEPECDPPKSFSMDSFAAHVRFLADTAYRYAEEKKYVNKMGKVYVCEEHGKINKLLDAALREMRKWSNQPGKGLFET